MKFNFSALLNKKSCQPNLDVEVVAARSGATVLLRQIEVPLAVLRQCSSCEGSESMQYHPTWSAIRTRVRHGLQSHKESVPAVTATRPTHSSVVTDRHAPEHVHARPCKVRPDHPVDLRWVITTNLDL